MICRLKTWLKILKLALLSMSIVLILGFYQIQKAVDQERLANEHEATLVRLGVELADASDYLTWAVKTYTITLDPEYIQRYWHEVDVDRHRDKVVAQIKKIDIPKAEQALLEQAKNESDALIATETRGMKLILQVFHVPEALMHSAIHAYTLSEADQRLSDADKIHTARRIMFDAQYNRDKEKIMAPIHQFQTRAQARIHRATQEAERTTNRLLWFCASLLMIIFASITLVLYLHQKITHEHL